MFWYQCQLALRSIRKAPILSSVMVFVLATGVAITTVSYTHYYHLKKNPLTHKDDNLFYCKQIPGTKSTNTKTHPTIYRHCIAIETLWAC